MARTTATTKSASPAAPVAVTEITDLSTIITDLKVGKFVNINKWFNTVLEQEGRDKNLRNRSLVTTLYLDILSEVIDNTADDSNFKSPADKDNFILFLRTKFLGYYNDLNLRGELAKINYRMTDREYFEKDIKRLIDLH